MVLQRQNLKTLHRDHAHTYLFNCLRDKVSYIVTDNATNMGKAAAFLFKNVIQSASRNLNGEVYLTSCVIDPLRGYHWICLQIRRKH